MNEKDEKVELKFQPELTFTIEKQTLQKFFDGLADKIAERTAVYLAVMLGNASREEQPATPPAAEPIHDDPTQPWGNEPDTEGGEE